MLPRAVYRLLASVLLLGRASAAQQLPVSASDRAGQRLEIQAHRGGAGLRSEETLWAFAHAIELGADTLEMDMVWTSDGQPVIWHDHAIAASKCRDTEPGKTYVGHFIANLTLAELKTLDCGSRQLLPDFPQQQPQPAKIATLGQVLELVQCYGDDGVTINLETKLDPLAPHETLPADKYIDDLIPYLEAHAFCPSRVTIQSFDWRTLVGIKAKFPAYTTSALLDDRTSARVDRGVAGYPWLGGVNLDSFGGNWVQAAHSIGAGIVSPVHGLPSNLTVMAEHYRPFTTRAYVDEAHRLGMKLIPWTADYEVTIDAMISTGADAVISNYPQRVEWVARDRGMLAGRPRKPVKPECLLNANR